MLDQMTILIAEKDGEWVRHLLVEGLYGMGLEGLRAGNPYIWTSFVNTPFNLPLF